MLYKILKLLKKKKFVKDYSLLDFKQGEAFYYIKMKVIFSDKSILFIREYMDREEFLYSYHWQDKEGKLLYRWDNAPYHKEIETFPYHLHYKNKIKESKPVSIEEVLEFIEKTIGKNNEKI